MDPENSSGDPNDTLVLFSTYANPCGENSPTPKPEIVLLTTLAVPYFSDSGLISIVYNLEVAPPTI